MHKSLVTIDSPEFINLQPSEISPLISQCEIKVFYLGENRNHTYIDEATANKMAKTLRGSPIVGYYKESKQDYGDHGEELVINDEGIHVNCLTVPYGFVAPDAKIWFQNFEDYDDFGNAVVHKYLMTTGYLWTEQFKECQKVIDEGRPQSMELDEKTLEGHWSTNVKSGMDFFIINDATFSKLCILGDDVEPCFEGSSVTAPEVSKNFSLDDNFKMTLFNMMQELKQFALKGGTEMDTQIQVSDTVETEVVETPVTKNTVAENDVNSEINPDSTVDSYKKSEDDTKSEENNDSEDKDSSKDSEDSDEKKKDDVDKHECKSDDKDKKTNHSLEQDYEELNTQYTALKEKYLNLEKDYQELVEFKLNIDNQKKDELIESFYMLSDEDKKDVIENKANYSYDEIEAKLSVICVRNKVSFSMNEKTDEDVEKPITIYNVQEIDSAVPAWIAALKSARQNNN